MDLRDIIKHETARILEAASAKSRTIRASEESIRRSRRIPPMSPWKTYDGQKINLRWRFPDQKWAYIQVRLERSIQERMLLSGLAASAWNDLADLMDERIDIAAKIKKMSKPPGFRARSKVVINEDPNRFFITISHDSRALYYANGRQALFAAIAGRISFYRKNEKLGVFKSAQAVAKKYPGVKVSTSTS